LQKEKVDILVLATDAIVTYKILKLPQLATLNAHLGWIPLFRGLGSNCFQLEKGKFPAISVHKVDEGVDTGPLILRECIEVDPKCGLNIIEDQISLLQRDLLLKTIKMFIEGSVEYIDTFEEPSNMTRGMSLKQRKALDRKLKSGKLKLSSFDGLGKAV
jgi:folate-dependent phosphoribosylglycinamide formyltransferase PurN